MYANYCINTILLDIIESLFLTVVSVTVLLNCSEPILLFVSTFLFLPNRNRFININFIRKCDLGK